MTITAILSLIPTHTPTPTPTATPDMGYIYVWSSPAGGSIYVDGNYKGITDSSQYVIVSTTTGYHAVEISKAGYDKYSTSVYAYSGQYTTRNAYLTSTLTPTPSATPTVTPTPFTPTPTITPTPTPTPTPTQQVGTIIVTTNKPEATFKITGSVTYSGSGTYWSQSNVPVGTYTITYTALSGHISPPSETKTLRGGALIGEGSIIFSGTYTLIGTVTRETVTIEEIISSKCRDPNVSSKVTIYDYLTNTSGLVLLSDVEKLEYGSFAYVYTTDSPNEGFVCVFDSNTKDYKVYPAVKINLRTVDYRGEAVSGVEVYRRLPDNPTEIEIILAEQVFNILFPETKVITEPTKLIVTGKDIYDILRSSLEPQAKVNSIVKKLPVISTVIKVAEFFNAEYILVGKTNDEGHVNVWVLTNQETKFKVEEPIETYTKITKPRTEIDYNIRKVLNGYRWSGEATIKTGIPKTEEIRLKRDVSIVVIHRGSRDSNEIVTELQKFFRRESGVEIVPMTFENAESQQNLAKDKLLQESDIFVYILTNKDTAQAQIYYGDRFMPTLKNREIIDENGKKYTNEANGIVSCRVYESDNNLNGRNYYLIAGIGNNGLRNALNAFMNGEINVVVGPPPKIEQKGNVLDKIKDFIDRLFRRNR